MLQSLLGSPAFGAASQSQKRLNRNVGIARSGEAFGDSSQQLVEAAKMFLVNSCADQPQNSQHLFDVFARAMNALCLVAILEALERVLDSPAP